MPVFYRMGHQHLFVHAGALSCPLPTLTASVSINAYLLSFSLAAGFQAATSLSATLSAFACALPRVRFGLHGLTWHERVHLRVRKA